LPTQQWVDFGDYYIRRYVSGTKRLLLARDLPNEPPEYNTLSFTGWPVENKSMVVQNPKDIVTHGLPNIPSLRSDMVSTMLQIMDGTWAGGDSRDAALAYAPAVFLLQQAVDGMAQAKKLGAEEEKKEEEEERKRKEALILLIIGVALVAST
jgi:chitinase